MEKLGTLRRVLVLGCNECVTVCGVGGEREVGVLASELRLTGRRKGRPSRSGSTRWSGSAITSISIRSAGFAADYDVILSMACGAGVQYVAEAYKPKLVIPAVNTTFLGVTLEQGVWSERCQGCGSCILDMTAGDLSDRAVCEEPAERALRRFVGGQVRDRQGDGLRLAVDRRPAEGIGSDGALRGDPAGEGLAERP